MVQAHFVLPFSPTKKNAPAASACVRRYCIDKLVILSIDNVLLRDELIQNL